MADVLSSELIVERVRGWKARYGLEAFERAKEIMTMVIRAAVQKRVVRQRMPMLSVKEFQEIDDAIDRTIMGHINEKQTKGGCHDCPANE